MNEEPRMSADELMGRLSPSLSPWRRVLGAVPLVSGLVGAAFVGLLWATEPGPLPGRTQAAFAVFLAFCLAWACYGGWAVTRRAPLFALDRVIAGWLALAASTVMTVVTVTAAVQRGTGLLLAAGIGAAFVAVSAVVTVRAHVRRAALLRRRRELTREEE
ncbi:hypothetical protein AB0B45_00100 [Nonomuraea sp. NPDC049152]|uniref:hypothetical protein n=1 Tax=Nonomuraea sp. NPDC049152 TaxID=3154350 RepID=UPI0033F2A783